MEAACAKIMPAGCSWIIQRCSNSVRVSVWMRCFVIVWTTFSRTVDSRFFEVPLAIPSRRGCGLLKSIEMVEPDSMNLKASRFASNLLNCDR